MAVFPEDVLARQQEGIEFIPPLGHGLAGSLGQQQVEAEHCRQPFFFNPSSSTFFQDKGGGCRTGKPMQGNLQPMLAPFGLERSEAARNGQPYRLVCRCPQGSASLPGGYCQSPGGEVTAVRLLFAPKQIVDGRSGVGDNRFKHHITRPWFGQQDWNGLGATAGRHQYQLGPGAAKQFDG